MFNELRHGISEIASLADPEVGELRIGTTPPMSAVASAVFNHLVPRYPRMRFELSVGPTDVLLRQLQHARTATNQHVQKAAQYRLKRRGLPLAFADSRESIVRALKRTIP